MASEAITKLETGLSGSYLTKRRAALVITVLFFVLIFAFIISLALGSEHISLANILSGTLTREQEVIIFGLRLPRIILAIGSGAALAMAGAAFQALLRNPLADPYVLGVSSGAALGAIVGIMFASQFSLARPLLSFAGASAATFVVYLLGRRGDDPARLILAGVVISTLLGSLMVLLTTLADDLKLRNITFWLLGDLSSGSSEFIAFLFFAVAIGAVTLFANSRALNLMMTGERDAFALGVETNRVRWIVFITASLLTAAAVSTSGAIGYVGLVVPHLVRLASGTDNRLVIPASAFAGALLVLLADTTARTAIAPRELPTGAITALIGAPVLVYLLLGKWKGKTRETGMGGNGVLRATDFALMNSAVAAGQNLLRLENVSFGYSQQILSDINLEIKAGEVVALLGQNGAGKSTLLNLAAGKLQPNSGSVLWQEKSISEFSRREIAQKIALVAQAEELHFPLTVLAGRFAQTAGIGFDSPSDIEIAMQTLAATDSSQFASRSFNQLSSGEKQRVVLARALAQQPQILLLDEPTANLDIAHQFSLLEFVTQLAQQHQLGILFVTHEINLVAEFSDRVALLKHGKIIALGKPDEVMTADLLSDLFETKLSVNLHPNTGKPIISVITGK
jgi:iron complex transport system permease protein